MSDIRPEFPEMKARFARDSHVEEAAKPARIDPVQEALDSLNVAYESESDPHEVACGNAAAQVFATLALVEQQRIANLIAYWQLHTPRSAAESLEHRHIEVSLIETDIAGGIDVEVREGLGLS